MTFRYPIPHYPHRGGMIVFEGSRRQRGGNLFSTIQRVLMPKLKSIGKDVAKRGIKVGVNTLKEKLTQKDNSASMKDILKRQTAQAMGKAMTDYLGNDDVPMSSQDGAGRRRRRKRKVINKVTRQRRRKGKAKRSKKQFSRDIFG